MLNGVLTTCGIKTIQRGIYDPEAAQTAPRGGYPLASVFEEPQRPEGGATGGRVYEGNFGIQIFFTGPLTAKWAGRDGRGLEQFDDFNDAFCDQLDVAFPKTQVGVLKILYLDSIPYFWMEEIAIGGLIRVAYNYSRTPPATGNTKIGPFSILQE